MKATAALETRAPITFGGELGPRIERTLSRLPSDAGIMSQFLSELAACNRAPKSIMLYLNAVQSLLQSAKKPIEAITKQDIIGWCAELEKKVKQSTATRYKILLRRFFRWFHTGQLDGDGYPEIVAWLKPKEGRRELGKQILTREEIKALMQATRTERDRAMVVCAYESGCRVSEFLGLRIGDVQIDRYGVVIRIEKGKTGGRRLRLVESAPDLQDWLARHPHRNDPKAPLWPRSWDDSKPLGRYGWTWILKQLAKRAKIKKPVNPHQLRHTRATHLSNVLKEPLLREYFGWSRSSDMPGHYIHLDGKDIDKALLQHYNIKTDEEKDEKTFVLKHCPRCKQANSGGAVYCARCGCHLDVGLAGNEAEDLVGEVIQGLVEEAPKVLEMILEKRKLKPRISEIARAAGGS